MRRASGVATAMAVTVLTTLVSGQVPSGQIPPSIGASRPRPPAGGAPGFTDEQRTIRCQELKGLMDALGADDTSSPLRKREIADYQRMRDQLSCPSETAKTAPASGRPNWEGTWEIINGDPYGGEFAGRREATMVLHRSSPSIVLSKASADPFKAWRMTCPTGPGGFDAYEGTMTIEPSGYIGRYTIRNAQYNKQAPIIACTDFAGTTETLLNGAFMQTGGGYNSGDFAVMTRTGESGQFKGEQYEFSGTSNNGIWYGRRVKQ